MALSRPLSRPLSSALSRPLTGVAESRPRISGFAFPGEELTGEGAGQWYVDGVAVSGETGDTYEVRLTDIGKLITQEVGGIMSSAKKCWHPRQVPQVVTCRVPFSNVFSAISPDVPAVPDDTVRAWRDIVNSFSANQGDEGAKPKLVEENGMLCLEFDGVDDYLLLVTPQESNAIHGATEVGFMFAGNVTNTGNASPLSLLAGTNIIMAFRADQFQYRKIGSPADSLRSVSIDGYQEEGNVVLFASASTTTEVTRKNGVEITNQSSYSSDAFDETASSGRIGDRNNEFIAGQIYFTALLVGSISARDLSRMERFAMLCMGSNYEGPDIPLVP